MINRIIKLSQFSRFLDRQYLRPALLLLYLALLVLGVGAPGASGDFGL